ncbi:hypothetical protein [Cellvibrio sp. UBA7671]|uniref:hypothetical protein n=1 Tax=Cellvibrio sp. UBA7671 TaxID=1946312 RepID=UPI002F34FB76
MKVYFEGEKYSKACIDNRVIDYFNELNVTGEYITEYVGYYSDHIHAPVFFLPKIGTQLVNNDKDIYEYLAKTGLHVGKTHIKGIQIPFLSKIAYLLYLSLIKFIKRKPETQLSMEGRIFDIKLKRSSMGTTELETVIALESFYKQHEDMLAFSFREANEKKCANVDWGKTIRCTSPYISNQTVIYAYPINQEEDADYSNKILIVYFSLLSYLSKQYGKKFTIDHRLELISHKNFNSFSNRCRKLLKKTKGQNFDDRFIRLSKLLTAYFDIQSFERKKSFSEDKLLIKGYNFIFEDMIDLLLSDQAVISDLKNQRDGKIVDHIYQYNSLFDGDDIYYIGDSKYYKDSTSFSKHSKYKQFTYAKNVIQFNVDPFGEQEQLTYRDELTEGYNLSPNFFINGYLLDSTLTNPQPGFMVDHQGLKNPTFLCQFKNRIFDRDSLYLCYFKLNFLFILQSYVIENKITIIKFREQTYKVIREHFINLYNERYKFFRLQPHVELDAFTEAFFRKLHGKTYRSYKDIQEGTITLGLDWNEAFTIENAELLNFLSMHANILEFRLR